MRLQLTAVLVAACWSGCASGLSTEVRTDGRYYDDRTVQVRTPSVEATLAQGDKLRVDGHWKADVISAATPVMAAPDTVTRATEYSETRHEVGVGTEWKPRSSTTLGGGYTASLEPDHSGHTVTSSVSQKLFGEQSTLTVGGRANWNRVGSVDMPGYSRQLWVVGGDVGWTQILNESSLVRGNYSLIRREGYQANPYRYVPIWGDRTGAPESVAREHLPESRTRHAIQILGVWGASYHLFVRAAYRFYFDGWDVRSHMLRGAVWWESPNDWLRLRLRGRGYTQSGARFFRPRYTERNGFRTGDYRLSSMTKLEGGVRADLRLSNLPVGRRMTGSISYDLAHYWFETYPVFDTMFAHVVTLSLEVKFP